MPDRLAAMDRFGELGFSTVARYLRGGVLFRVDAGHVKGLSTGHLFRGIAIAEDLGKRGMETMFIMKDYPLARQIAEDHRLTARFFSPSADGAAELARAREEGWDSLVVDYPAANADFSRYPDFGAWVWIDDEGTGDGLPVDPRVSAIVRPSVVVREAGYRLSGATAVHEGGDYFFPNRDLRAAKEKRAADPEVNAVTVFMGGTDPYGYTVLVIPPLVSLGMKVTALVGGGNKRKDTILQLEGEHVRVVVAPPDAAAFFADARFAVVSGGLVSYEAWYMGIPSVILPSTDIERENRRAFYGLIEAKLTGTDRGDWMRLRDALDHLKGEPLF